MRRAPLDRQRDPVRTKARIVEAAIAEFAAKGYAGARTGEIAARAGVNRQLISYYFGGKEGLYGEATARWRSEENRFAGASGSLGQLVGGYVRANAANRDLGKLLVWQGLTDNTPPDPAFAEDMRRNVEYLRQRQAAGDFPSDLDPAAVLVALFAVAGASIAFPQLVRAVFEKDPASREFAEHYAEQVERLVGHLRR